MNRWPESIISKVRYSALKDGWPIDKVTGWIDNQAVRLIREIDEDKADRSWGKALEIIHDEFPKLSLLNRARFVCYFMYLTTDQFRGPMIDWTKEGTKEAFN